MSEKKILIVDDDPLIIDKVKEILSQETPYDVLEAEDGEKGLIAAIKNFPDLIILDVEMPKMRGWEVCKLLKHNTRTHKIPILMLTSRSELSDIIVAMQIGAEDYLSKPFKETDLLERIDRLLKKKESEAKSSD